MKSLTFLWAILSNSSLLHFLDLENCWEAIPYCWHLQINASQSIMAILSTKAWFHWLATTKWLHHTTCCYVAFAVRTAKYNSNSSIKWYFILTRPYLVNHKSQEFVHTLYFYTYWSISGNWANTHTIPSSDIMNTANTTSVAERLDSVSPSPRWGGELSVINQTHNHNYLQSTALTRQITSSFMV